MRARLIGAVLALLLVPNAQPLPASGGGILSFGTPIPGDAGVGRRQLVRLERVGSILRGKPSSGPVALITLRTRHQAPESTLVVWERRRADGTSLIQISVPPRLAGSVMGATLFFPADQAETRVAQAQGGRWVDLEPVGVTGQTGPATPAVRSGLLAYPVNSLGFFVRSPRDAAGAYPRSDPNAFDTGTRLARAAWHLLWPVVLLVVLMALSRRHHGEGAA